MYIDLATVESNPVITLCSCISKAKDALDIENTRLNRLLPCQRSPKQMSLPVQDDDRHLFEHFVIAGLDYNASEQLLPPLQECGCRNIQPLAPITDLVVIFPSLGETVSS